MTTGAPAARPRRLASYRRGRLAESVAAWYLRLRGYRILRRGYRVPVGEIDIIARRGDVLAVVEVKGRETLGAAAEAVSRRQQARIARAAAAFLGAHPPLAGLSVRFDVMLVAPWRLPVHLRDAWRLRPAASKYGH
jgi:putative endonuclease